MLIAHNTKQLDDLLILIEIMKQMLADEGPQDLEAAMNKCGFVDNNETVIGIKEVNLSANNDALHLIVRFTFENDEGKNEDGYFYMTVKDGVLNGDY